VTNPDYADSTKRTKQMRIDELSSSNLLVPWILLRQKNLDHVSKPSKAKFKAREQGYQTCKDKNLVHTLGLNGFSIIQETRDVLQAEQFPTYHSSLLGSFWGLHYGRLCTLTVTYRA
jgi:hypothetical protein